MGIVGKLKINNFTSYELQVSSYFVMKYSYKWLKELSGTKKSVEQVADLLTFHAFEIEGIEKNENSYDKVVVGEILEINPHPNAEKLQLAKVNVGKEVLKIVCGAKNIQVGDKVPVALVGAKLPNGLEIKEAEIRGEKSHGMLCAEDELGLGADHSGIMILEKDLKTGTSISSALDLDDEMIEIDVLANRAADALSHVGMAREIAALEGKESDYDYDGLRLPKKSSKKLKVKIADKEICPRYIGAVIEGIEVKESPQWIKNKLIICGLRPINNIVDATNLVMLEIGQPLHAFDFEEISTNGKSYIEIRKAEKGERIRILDESEKVLSGEDIVIANERKAIALAGVMGGFESGVTEKTTSLVLEAASFKPSSVRKTRMNHGLATDAAIRFEKNLDPNLAEKAMVRLIEIITHIAGGEVEGIVDEYVKKEKEISIVLDLDHVNKLLGEDVPKNKSKKILSSLGMKVSGSGKKMKVIVPSFRRDLNTQEDLAEEIGRAYGYEKIKAVPPIDHVRPAKVNEARFFERRLKGILVAEGFSEVYNYSFAGEWDIKFSEFIGKNPVEIENSISPDQKMLRVGLLPGLLRNVKENLKNFKEFSIFEAGKVYWAENGTLPQEKKFLAGVMVFEKNSKKEKAAEFFEAKGCLDNVLKNIGIADFYYDTFRAENIDNVPTIWHGGRTAEIKIEGSQRKVGILGEINPMVLSSFGIEVRVVAFEFEMENLHEISDEEMEYRPIRKYPIVIRDVSMVSKDPVRVDDILQSIQEFGRELILDVELFDIFDFDDGSTSFAFHIVMGADDRTLGGGEIEKLMKEITEGLERKHKMEIRK